jgi:hypothetical protein
VPHAFTVDPQNPPRTVTTKPIRGWLNRTRCQKVIAFPVFAILHVGRQMHSGRKVDWVSVFIWSRVFMRQTQQVTKHSIEICPDFNFFDQNKLTLPWPLANDQRPTTNDGFY